MEGSNLNTNFGDHLTSNSWWAKIHIMNNAFQPYSENMMVLRSQFYTQPDSRVFAIGIKFGRDYIGISEIRAKATRSQY